MEEQKSVDPTQAAMLVLQQVADRNNTSTLASFTSQFQYHCQTFCSDKVVKEVKEKTEKQQ